MKSFKRITAVILCLCLMFSVSGIAFARETQPAAYETALSLPGEESYPYVLVHGMMGWGENNEGQSESAYWGMLSDKPIAEILREKGYEVAVPTVAPMGSAWDRACELFAQLCGTVVDYGKAHSEAHNHERFGRDYTGKALLGENGWDVKTPINLVTHSFGGPTGYVFTSMLEYGVKEEAEASTEDCSELFKGGHGGLVYSMTTLESPHNGSPVANLINDGFFPLLLAAVAMNVSGSGKEVKTDFMVDQFGLTTPPSSGERAKFSLKNCWQLATSKDHCGQDMTLDGAKALYEKFKVPSQTYLFSSAANATETNKLGLTVPSNFSAKNILSYTVSLVIALSGLPINRGRIPGREWAANDGLVPVISALHPFGQKAVEYDENAELETGVWYVLPVVENANHGYGMAGTEEKLEGIWDSILTRIENISSK